MPLLRWLPLALIALAAFWLRTRDLDQRPMHADEANQAVKLGELLEAGRYTYDPRDHHGPTLYYAAVPLAWARGERSLAALSETTLRLVPAIFGTLAVALIAILALPLGRWPALAAAAFVAVSPPAVYYSRYFIQETLLVTFTLAALVCARQWWQSGRMAWAVAAGGCAGLMQATKATAPLFLAAAAVAALALRGKPPARGANAPEAAHPPAQTPPLRAAFLAALAAAAVVGVIFYSSFFTHWQGVADALAAYGHALARFGFSGEAPPTGHEKPWWYYVHLFGWFRTGGLVWHQLAFSALAVAGAVVALVSRAPFLRWALVYTVIVVAAFSALAYKTPWHVVHFVPGMALLAAGSLAALARLRTGKFVALAAVVLALGSQYQQVVRVAFLRPADGRNPYAYVHSSPDVKKYRALAEAALARHPGQPVRVISEEYWPLPWYLRGLPRVGFWSTPPDECDGALVIVSASQADAVRPRLRGTYRESFLGLRPGFVCVVFTRE